MKFKNEPFGNTYLGMTISIILLHIFFYDEPDVVDGIRQIVLNYAGIQ